MPTPRKIPCPLCQVPLRPSAFSSNGICPVCEDKKRDSKRENRVRAAENAQKTELAAEARAKNFKSHVKDVVKKKEKKIEEKARKEEKKALTEVQREQASRELARRSLLHYAERRNPKYDSSWAHELVASQLEEFYNEVERKENPRMIITLPSRFGKALINKTKILTANRGWTTHGELEVGDEVFGSTGRPTKVVAVSEEHECDMEVEFSNGQVLGAHRHHEWAVFDKAAYSERGVWKVLETQDMEGSEKYHGNQVWRYWLPNTPALQMPEQELPVDPYVIALYFADGSVGKNIFTQHVDETECMAEVERRGYEVYHTADHKDCRARSYYIRGKNGRFIDELKEAGITDTKFVPDIYLKGSVQQRLDFLSGLCDGDSGVLHGRVRFVNTNKNLIDAARTIALSLGYTVNKLIVQPAKTVTRKHRKTKLMFKSHEQAKYTLCFTIPPGAPMLPMRHPEKYSRLRFSKRSLAVSIHDIRLLEDGLMGKCIEVSAEDGIYLAGETLTPTHNSELASISGPAWALGHHPHWNVVLSSYAENLPTAFSRNIRAQLQDPDFKGLFPSGGRLNPVDSSAQAWTTQQGGSLRAIGVGGGLLGFGADVLTIDDPVKSTEDANNPQTLQKMWDWFSSIAYSRLMPGGGILIIQQRMAVDDLVGRVMAHQHEEEARLTELRKDIDELISNPPLEKISAWEREIQLLEEEAEELDASMDRWRYLEYPALATMDEYYDKQAGEIMRLPSGHKPNSAWKPLRKRGEALHERRYSRSYLLKLKRVNPKMFQAMYMLNPVLEEGAYFGVADFQRYDRSKHPKLEHMHVFTAWDLAIGTKQSNDYTVGVAGAMDYTGKLWLLDMVRGKFGDVREVADLVIDLHTKWGSSITGIEHTHVSMALGPILKSRMAERNEYINIAEGKEKLVPTADKAVRARQLQGLCRGGKFAVPNGEEFDDYIAEMTRFLSGGHDDVVDASAWLAILALRNSPPRKPGTAEKQQRREENWLADLLLDMADGELSEQSYMGS